MRDRIKYIDIAKGICMLGVVLLHVSHEFSIKYSLTVFNNINAGFFMAPFFILSGFFIKHEPMLEFIIKKAKVLIVPFFIFYILGFIFAFIASELLNIPLNNEFSWSNIFSAFYSRTFSNGAIWFLLALFFSSVILQFSLRIKNETLKVLYVLSIATIGFYWNKLFELRLPLYIDTAFTAILFLYIGSHLKNKIKYIHPNWILIFATFILSFVSIYYSEYTGGMMLNYYHNKNIVLFYMVSITSFLFILFIAITINTSKYLEYIGKNSLIILCTHFFFIKPIHKILINIGIKSFIGSIISFVIICALMFPIIFIVNKYLPFIIGKKK